MATAPETHDFVFLYPPTLNFLYKPRKHLSPSEIYVKIPNRIDERLWNAAEKVRRFSVKNVKSWSSSNNNEEHINFIINLYINKKLLTV